MSFRSFARRQDRTCVTSAAGRIRSAVVETLESRRLLASVPITNHSFENPALSDGQTSSPVSGWTFAAVRPASPAKRSC